MLVGLLPLKPPDHVYVAPAGDTLILPASLLHVGCVGVAVAVKEEELFNVTELVAEQPATVSVTVTV
jgi:hypothetical protein